MATSAGSLEAPRGCTCCHHLAQLVHALAGPTCALKTVYAAMQAPLRPGGDDVRARQALFAQALARLDALWQQGTQQAAQALHQGPCPACGGRRCRFSSQSAAVPFK